MDEDSKIIEHFDRISKDIRDEILLRIAQRDNYSTQMIISLAAIFAVSIGSSDLDKVILVAPLVSIYYTVLILYSYKIHQGLSDYLINVIYAKYEKLLLKHSVLDEWEIYYKNNISIPGIRKKFFKVVMVVITLLSGVILTTQYGWNEEFGKIVRLTYMLYTLFIFYILFALFREEKSGVRRFYPKLLINRKPNIAVFLDRDGTINEDTHYPHKIKDLHVYKEALEALSLLKSEKVKVVIVTNQSGISLGFFKISDMKKFNKALLKQIRESGGKIDAVYYSKDKEPECFAQECTSTAKPSTAMFKKAAKDLNINLSNSFLIGDKKTDIAAGLKLGIHSILVKTGKKGQDYYYGEINGFDVRDNILDAVKEVIRIMHNRKDE